MLLGSPWGAEGRTPEVGGPAALWLLHLNYPLGAALQACLPGVLLRGFQGELLRGTAGRFLLLGFL